MKGFRNWITSHRSVFILIVFAILVLSTVCTRNVSEVLKIGVVNSLTGQYAPYGENNINGIRMAIEEINSSGGINGKTLEAIIEDDRSTTEGAVSSVKKLINTDKVPVIIGPGSSSGVMASAPIANNSQVVLLSPGAASPTISNAGEYVFRNRSSGALEASKIANYVSDELRISSVCILYPNLDYGIGFKNVFHRVYTAKGGIIYLEETYDEAATDFRSQLSKIKVSSPEGIYVLGVPSSVGLILRQAREIGINSKFFSNNVESSELLQSAGDAAEGLIYAIPTYDPNTSIPRVREFEKEYYSRFRRHSDLFAANGYDAVYIIARAIEIGGHNGDGIKKALYDIPGFEGVSGTISFDENGDVVKPLSIRSVRHGEFVSIEEEF